RHQPPSGYHVDGILVTLLQQAGHRIQGGQTRADQQHRAVCWRMHATLGPGIGQVAAAQHAWVYIHWVPGREVTESQYNVVGLHHQTVRHLYPGTPPLMADATRLAIDSDQLA